MFKFIKNSIQALIERNRTQARVNLLIAGVKKADYITLRLPKSQIPILEVLALYGIKDSVQLLQILESNMRNSKNKERCLQQWWSETYPKAMVPNVNQLEDYEFSLEEMRDFEAWMKKKHYVPTT